jgi:hypothetical protein
VINAHARDLISGLPRDRPCERDSAGALTRERFDQIFEMQFAFLEGSFFELFLRCGMRECGVVADLLIELVMLDEQLMEILSFGHAPPPDENLLQEKT